MRLLHLLSAAAILLTGCRSASIQATLSNRTGERLSLIEVDYPSASFGTQALASGQQFQYRFKVLGNGPTLATWNDTAGVGHKSTGPSFKESDRGTLTVSFTAPDTAVWRFTPSNP
jgi:hypothetical protein